MRGLLIFLILVGLILAGLFYFDFIQLGTAGEEAIDAAEDAIGEAVDGATSE